MASFFPNIPTAAYPLGVGLLVTSCMFFGNIGLSLVGPLPIIKEKLGASALSPKDKVRIWKLFFDEAAFYIVAGTGITAALHLAVPFLTSAPNVPALAVASAVLSVAVLPYTIVFIRPTNAALGALDKKAEFSAAEAKNGEELIAKWDTLHKVRYLMYGGAWATGLAALMAVVARS